MAQVSEVMNASLKRVIVVGSNSQIDPEDAQDFMFAMNTFMADLAADGVNLGYTDVDSLDDEVTIPVGALRGLLNNMAIEVGPDYGAVIPNELRVNAASGLKRMYHLGITRSTSRYPSTLPVGSGNEGDSSFRNSHYYPAAEAEILAEVNGPIALEDDTEAA